MPRVKRSIHARKKRRKVLEQAKGYWGLKSKTYKRAKEQVEHSLVYAYRDRKNRKRDFRRLWIIRINAAARDAPSRARALARGRSRQRGHADQVRRRVRRVGRAVGRMRRSDRAEGA